MLEGGRDLCVRPVDGERKVARPLLLVVDDGREAAMELPSRDGVDVLVRRGGEERVREAENAVLDVEDVCLEGRPKHFRLVAGLAKKGESRLCQGRRRGERVEGSLRQHDQPVAHELAELLRDRQRLTGRRRCPASRERATQLQRVEGIAARHVVEPAQGGPGEGEADPGVEEAVDRAEAERRDLQATRSFPVHERRRCLLPQALGDQEARRLLPNPPPREAEHGGRRGVEPLNVIDGDEQRTIRGVLTESAQDRDGNRPLVGRRALRSFEQERDTEGVGLRRRERVEELVQPFVQQVAEACKGESGLGCGGSSLEDAVVELPSLVHAGLPEGGLPDAGVADENQRSGAAPERVEEVVELPELLLTADHVHVGRDPHLPGSS